LHKGNFRFFISYLLPSTGTLIFFLAIALNAEPNKDSHFGHSQTPRPPKHSEKLPLYHRGKTPL